MSGDEVSVLVVCGILSVIGWGRWYYHIASATRIGDKENATRLPLYVTPLLCGTTLLVILISFASYDVRDSALYLFFYMAMGSAWLYLAVLFMPLLGVNPRLDGLQRRNSAATTAVVGAMLGVTFAFAGGNIGDGPGWWVVVFSSGVATVTLLALWAVVACTTDLTDHLTIERDRAAGLRFAAFMLAAGAILGRGAAGDWTTASQMVDDFVTSSWPVLGLAAVQITVERHARPTAEDPQPQVMFWGFIPSCFHVGVAAARLAGVGPW